MATGATIHGINRGCPPIQGSEYQINTASRLCRRLQFLIVLLVLDVHILTLGGQEHRIRWKFFHFFVFRSIRTTRLLSSCFVFSSRVPPARTLAKRSVKCLSVCRIFFRSKTQAFALSKYFWPYFRLETPACVLNRGR